LPSTETSSVAHRYAFALFDLARQEGRLDEVEGDVDRMRALVDESDDLRRLMRSPVFSADEQTRALTAVMERAEVGGLTANLVKLAARNRRLFAVPEMLKAFAELLAEHRGEVIAIVTSAEPLSDEQLAALKEALSDKGGGTVKLETRVDPSLIGGLVVRLGSQMIDTSVRTRLQGLRVAMKEAA
jgi:F-type H+-transporting ATPase subunit delta